MPLQPHPFRGPTFFVDARVLMNQDRGMFGGEDGDLLYVVMDATFYRMEIFVRPGFQTFTDGALVVQAAEPAIRALCNGQNKGGGWTSYEAIPDPAQDFEGQIIVAHFSRRARPKRFPAYPHIGQWDGRSEVAFSVARGEPGDVMPRYNHAMGYLYPVIEDRVRAGVSDIRDSSGNFLTRTSTVIRDWIQNYPPETGKVIVGIHRSTQSLFILVQRHKGPNGGKAMADIIALLGDMGVDDALMGDGSSSVALIVDHAVEEGPLGPKRLHKNCGITTGLMFRLQSLSLAQGAQMAVRPPSTDPRFPPTTALAPIEGRVTLVAGGCQVELTSLGRLSASLAPGSESTAAVGSTNAMVPAGTVLAATRGEISFPVVGALPITRVMLTSLGVRQSSLGAAGWLSAGGLSTDPDFPPTTRVVGPAGLFRISVENGGELEIQSLGAREAVGALPVLDAAQTAARLGVMLPLRLTSTSAPPGTVAHYAGPSTSAELQVQFAGSQNVALVGVLTITTVLGIAQFAVQWPLSRTPHTELEVAGQLGLSLPLNLRSLATDLSQVVDFFEEGVAGPGVTTAHLRASAIGGPHGSLVGTLEIDKPSGQVTLDVQWPLSNPLPDAAGTAAALGVNLPLILRSPDSNLAIASPFAGPPGSNVRADLRIESTRDTDGAMRGTLTFGGPQPLVFDVDWPLRS